MYHEFRHPLFGSISKEEAVKIVKTRDCSRKKWVQDMVERPYRYGDMIKKMHTSERLVTLRTIKIDVNKILETYLTGDDKSYELQEYSAALLLLSSEYVDIRSRFDEVLDHRIISEKIIKHGIEFFPLKALLILGYDISSPTFVEQIARKNILYLRVISFMDSLFSGFVDSVRGRTCNQDKKIDENWNFITHVMFLYYDVKPDNARKEYLMCSYPNEHPFEPYDLDACYFVPASDVCTNCESYGNLCKGYREFLKNVSLFELLFAHLASS